MIKNHTYQQISAYFFAGLILCLLASQSVHQLFSHANEDCCKASSTHYHDSGHSHLSCNVCLFHFELTELVGLDIKMNLPKNFILKKEYYPEQYISDKSGFSRLLGGPPASIIPHQS